jgi:hypothetical protein
MSILFADVEPKNGQHIEKLRSVDDKVAEGDHNVGSSLLACFITWPASRGHRPPRSSVSEKPPAPAGADGHCTNQRALEAG